MERINRQEGGQEILGLMGLHALDKLLFNSIKEAEASKETHMFAQGAGRVPGGLGRR